MLVAAHRVRACRCPGLHPRLRSCHSAAHPWLCPDPGCRRTVRCVCSNPTPMQPTSPSYCCPFMRLTRTPPPWAAPRRAPEGHRRGVRCLHPRGSPRLPGLTAPGEALGAGTPGSLPPRSCRCARCLCRGGAPGAAAAPLPPGALHTAQLRTGCVAAQSCDHDLLPPPQPLDSHAILIWHGAGLTQVSLLQYTLASWAGMLPGTFAYV